MLSPLNDLDFYFVSKQLQENGVYTVPQTQYTMDTLRLGWEQFLTNLKRAINEVEVQIMTREAHNISEAQLNDFRRCFNHFDRKRLRRLDLSEFKACLLSLGFHIPNTPEVSYPLLSGCIFSCLPWRASCYLSLSSHLLPFIPPSIHTSVNQSFMNPLPYSALPTCLFLSNCQSACLPSKYRPSLLWASSQRIAGAFKSVLGHVSPKRQWKWRTDNIVPWDTFGIL